MTDFQEGLLEIMNLPDSYVEQRNKEKQLQREIEQRQHSESQLRRHRKTYSPVEVDKRKLREGPVAKYFRERFKWTGSISLKAMGKELWSEYQGLRYRYKKYGNFEGVE